ncbi:nuclear speckle splicing regulatory protein 1 isoform X2 [Capsicum annuum]
MLATFSLRFSCEAGYILLPKYIQMLMEKAKQREREHEVIYERKIAKERSKDDHLYADKDKFVTAAYKRKLQEQAKWLEEERLRELKEERDDVTKKTDISDFYFSLTKNVAFGGEGKSKKAVNHHNQEAAQTEEKPSSSADAHPQMSREIKRQDHEPSVSPPRKERTDGVADIKPHSDGLSEERTEKPASDDGPTATTEPAVSDQPKVDHHKRNLDAVAAAKERFLARKKAKEQQ